MRRVVRSIDASLPLYDVVTMDKALGADGAGPRFNTWLLSLLAAAGLVLRSANQPDAIASGVVTLLPVPRAQGRR